MVLILSDFGDGSQSFTLFLTIIKYRHLNFQPSRDYENRLIYFNFHWFLSYNYIHLALYVLERCESFDLHRYFLNITLLLLILRLEIS